MPKGVARGSDNRSRDDLSEKALAIINQHQEPMSPAQVEAIIGYGRGVVFKRLLQLAKAGKITRLGYGLYQRKGGSQ
jgi:hypothetical protein